MDVPDEGSRKQIAARFQEFNSPYRTDPFKKVHHGTVRDWYDKGHIVICKSDWAAVLKTVKARHKVRDFSGTELGIAEIGESECQHFCWKDEGSAELIAKLKQVAKETGLWITNLNEENPHSRHVVERLNAMFLSSRISGVGAGDISGIYYVGKLKELTLPKSKNTICFAKVGEFDTKGMAKRLESLDFEVTDRGQRYGGPKKTWRRVNIKMAGTPSTGREGLLTHPVFAAVPKLLDVLELVAPLEDLDYTMLTRTSAEEGLIARHSDIALDAKAVKLGPRSGCTMRFHFVIQSNPECVFRLYNLRGNPVDLVMKTGEIWYTDVRKPHEVHNRGTTLRLHLMADFRADSKPWRKFSGNVLS